jgi:hypothetical protein
MPPKARPLSEELADALLDTKVVEALAKALSPFITLSIDEALGKRLEGLMSTVKDMKGDIARLTKQHDDVSRENAVLKKTIGEHERRMDDLESYSRSDNLIIRGLPEATAAERATDAALLDSNPSPMDSHLSVETTVIGFLQDSLGIEVSSRDISIAHRLKAGPRDSTRPVIVRFTNRKIRNLVFNSKKRLKDNGQRVFISEHLTKASSDLFFEARKLLREKKLFATWTQSGQVYVKFSSDPNTRAAVVKCRADLNLRP